MKTEVSKNTYTSGNRDNLSAAVMGLSQFTHNFCMNCAETEKTNDLVFRCHKCEFEKGAQCLIKEFVKNRVGTIPSNFGCMSR